MQPQASDPSEPERPAARARRRGVRLAPVLAAALPLLALAAATLFVHQRTTAFRTEFVQEVEPARALSDAIKYHLAREIALLRGYALTGSDLFLERYVANCERERELWPLLHSRTAALSADVALTARELEAAVDLWRATIHPDALCAISGEPPGASDLELGDLRNNEVLRLATQLSNDIAREQAVMVASMQRMESAHAVFTYVVILMSLVGTLAAAWLMGRVQAFATESESLRLEASRQAEIRTRLLRGLSHDVKNPLSAASVYAEMLQLRVADRLDGRERQWLERIHETIDTASGLLDDLVIFSLIDAGELDVQPQVVDPYELLEGIARSQEAAFEEAGVRLELRLPEGLPSVYTNPRRVEQVLTNLLSNARKYTPRGGGASMSADVDEDPATAAGRRYLAIRVSDTGPGIPPDRREAVFLEFTRLEPDTAPGYGLGLAISRSVAHAIGGDLSLKSAPGEGCTFMLRLPLPALRGGVRPRHAAAAPDPRDVAGPPVVRNPPDVAGSPVAPDPV